MKWSLAALLAGFVMDLMIGDPHWLPHPVRLIGKLISAAEHVLRQVFPKTEKGEKTAGAVLWLIVALASVSVPWTVLRLCYGVCPWLGVTAESIMCWQCIAVKALKDESMKVYSALKDRDLERARHAVSMIVGRDTDKLDDLGITRAAVETVAENTSDGAIAPILFLAVGGAAAGFFYKAVNTMDSMLGYTEQPYKNIGMAAAKADDIVNFIPARLSALLMLAAGWILRLDVHNGRKIFARDRYNHASPNSAQTESVCAGLLRVRLAGDAWYHGVLHKKKYIGDSLREIEYGDIPLSCRLLYTATVLAVFVCCAVKLIIML